MQMLLEAALLLSVSINIVLLVYIVLSKTKKKEVQSKEKRKRFGRGRKPFDVSALPDMQIALAEKARAEDVEAFIQALNVAFEHRDTTPFITLAMRVDDDHKPTERAKLFEFVQMLILRVLRDEDTFYADPKTNRFMVNLPNSYPEDAGDFFRALKRKIRAEVPDHADQVTMAISTIIIENGEPFPSGKAFWEYAMRET